jgi:hypothetical protein
MSFTSGGLAGHIAMINQQHSISRKYEKNVEKNAVI